MRRFARFAVAVVSLAFVAITADCPSSRLGAEVIRLSPLVLSSGGGDVGSIRYGADVAAGQNAAGKSSGLNFAVSFGYYNSFEVDALPPRTTVALSGASHQAGEKTYVSPSTFFAFTSADDLAETLDGLGFGVKETIYRIAGRPPAVYASPFTLHDYPDGDYSLAFHSIDLVGNVETSRLLNIALDGTPPVTAIFIGEPKFEAFGVTHVSPVTPITLSSIDPEMSGVASGVEVIEYAIDDGQYQVYDGAALYLPEGAQIIRYRARDKVGNVDEARSAVFVVARLADYAVSSIENIAISGHAKVKGNVAANETAQISGNAGLTGDVTASTLTKSGNAVVTGDIKIANPGINQNAINLDALRDIVSVANDNDKIPPTSRGKPAITEDGILKLASRDTLTITTGTYYLKGIEISARAQLFCDGKVNILLDGKAVIAGQGEIYTNVTASPFDTLIYQASTQTINVSGKGRFDAMIYAPYSSVDVTGQGISLGNILARDVKISGEAEVIGALERQKKLVASAPKAAASPRRADGIYDFGLRNAYVYPNPASNGTAPKIRLETGAADSVEIKIYNIAAELVAEAGIDGSAYKTSGGVCYYEQPIDATRLASGVYIYYILAKKSGASDIKVVKKFAVIK